MPREEILLKNLCEVASNKDGDQFVGIKSTNGKLRVCFPLGYAIPEDEKQVRDDIINLINVLTRFTEKRDYLLPVQTQSPDNVDFPIQAYMTIISSYLNSGYYNETEERYTTAAHGKIHWPRTIKQQRPMVGSTVYTEFTVKDTAKSTESLVSKINEYCVHESIKRLGWLFLLNNVPPKPNELTITSQNKTMCVGAVREKLAQTNLDATKMLFNSMIAMINYLSENDVPQQFYFGTTRFEYVWERLIDATFGVKDKSRYFPHTTWRLPFDKNKINAALEPDTIMISDNKAYVLDAKYYRFGETRDPMHLPASSSINKQITYGEYIHINTTAFGVDSKVYNAFLMPYNKKNWRAASAPRNIRKIGEATGDWKTGTEPYMRVQGILIDVRYLMYQYQKYNASEIVELASEIEEAISTIAASGTPVMTSIGVEVEPSIILSPKEEELATEVAATLD